MIITGALAHSLTTVSQQIQRIYAHNFSLQPEDVGIVMQGKILHIMLLGKAYEKMNANQISKIRYQTPVNGKEILKNILK